MIKANETFNGTWPFKPNFTDAPGFRMHYADEGQGDPILCLHGEPTWGYLYRNYIPKLSENYRVIVPDHMGFGKSETPQDRIYTHKTHVENLVALVKELDLNNITLVVQDWGAPIGGGLLLTVLNVSLYSMVCSIRFSIWRRMPNFWLLHHGFNLSRKLILDPRLKIYDTPC